MDRLRLLTIMSVASIIVVLVMTQLGRTSLLLAAVVMACFMVAMSGRFAPAMTMVTNSVEARYRGGFMSVNSALQQAAVGLANVLAGIFVTRDVAGHLAGMPLLGYVASACFVLTVLFAAELRAAAPHVSAPVPRVPEPVPSEAAV
jgi:MFS family permease